MLFRSFCLCYRQSSLRPPLTHTLTSLRTAAPRCTRGSALLPTAGGFAERGSQQDAAVRAAGAPVAGRGSPGEPRRASVSPAGSGSGPALPGLPGGWDGRRQLTRSALESESSTRSTLEPAVIFPAAPRPSARPMPGARSPLPAAVRIALL